MSFNFPSMHHLAIYANRRADLVKNILANYTQVSHGAVLLFAAFENEKQAFRQESSFYYYTGICEPGVALWIDVNGKTTLFVPHCSAVRAKWVASTVSPTQEHTKLLGVDEIRVLGNPLQGFVMPPFFDQETYQAFIDEIQKLIGHKGTVFTLAPQDNHSYVEQRLVLARLSEFVPALRSHVVDVSGIVAEMRRKKDKLEIELLYEAIGITINAQEAAAQSIQDGATEHEVQAGLEYMMIGAGARPSFPSIVASGLNSTILHYTPSDRIIKRGELVVVDIGAEYNYYCADLTRTYPVSGKFTKRQREVYELVLETQSYIADLAKPGMWLKNKANPEMSLHHLAVAFLKERGYDQYFIHGIGHYLGLDVHDVGTYETPLQEGDVITIEPGLYIPEENFGVRIEDNYWIVKDAAVCLSEDLAKSVEEIEKISQAGLGSAPSGCCPSDAPQKSHSEMH
jgi:Xaa-Pro aminopeptidase